MESGNTAANLDFLGWKTLEERRTGNKLSIFNKGLLGKIDIPTDHLKLTTRTTRRGGGGPQYTKEFSKIDAHRNSSHIISSYPLGTIGLCCLCPYDNSCFSLLILFCFRFFSMLE